MIPVDPYSAIEEKTVKYWYYQKMFFCMAVVPGVRRACRRVTSSKTGSFAISNFFRLANRAHNSSIRLGLGSDAGLICSLNEFCVTSLVEQ